eukprot:4659862-Prymnesium_polylepis.1
MQDAKKTTRLSADEARSPVGTAAEARAALEERDASSCGAPGAGAALSSRCCDGSAAPRKMPSARNRGPLLKHVGFTSVRPQYYPTALVATTERPRTEHCGWLWARRERVLAVARPAQRERAPPKSGHGHEPRVPMLGLQSKHVLPAAPE